MNRRLHRLGVVLAIGGLATLAGRAEPGGEPLVDVYMDGTGTTAVDAVLRSTAKVVLEDLRTIDEIPASARRTVVPESQRVSHRNPVGVRVPEGTREGSRAWLEADLLRREDAEIVLTHHDATRHQFVIAGYSYPKGPGEDRRPWMVLFTPEFLHARAEFAIQSSTDEAASLALREVAGLDGDRIYFKAESGDRRDFLVSARYTVRGVTPEETVSSR